MDGDICEPSEWRINNNEFASEFNGFLDSDNIKEGAVSLDIVKRDTFTKVLIDQRTTLYEYVFSHKRSGYSSQPDYRAWARGRFEALGGDGEWDGFANSQTAIEGRFCLDLPVPADMLVPPTEFKPLYDGDFWTAKVNPASSVISSATQSDPDHECRLPYHKFTTDGDALLIIDFSATVQQLHAFTLNNAEDFYNWVVFKLMGWGSGSEAIDFGTRAGRGYINSIGYPYRVKTTHKHPEKSALILCSIWRVLVDGHEICKTGMIGPELEAHPIYMTGATPVSSGEHTVELQGKTCWYCPTSGKQIPSSAIDTYIDWETDTDSDGYCTIFKDIGNSLVREKIRKDISLRQPNLIVQIRSR
jgi:hypothetical protein